MEAPTILQNNDYMYTGQYDFDVPVNISDLNNKLFCTFTSLEDLDTLIQNKITEASNLVNFIRNL